MYNDLTCNAVEGWYDFIKSSCYVEDYIREDCLIGAVFVCPKCGKCVEPWNDPSGLPSLEPSKNPSKVSTYASIGKPSLGSSQEPSVFSVQPLE